jgi:hypothetical protein
MFASTTFLLEIRACTRHNAVDANPNCILDRCSLDLQSLRREAGKDKCIGGWFKGGYSDLARVKDFLSAQIAIFVR